MAGVPIPGVKSNIFIGEVDNLSAISEDTWFKIGAAINFINENATEQIGDVKISMLTLAQFQAKRNATWVLQDGQDVTGSGYHALTGKSSVPDQRGRFPRMQDNGAGVDPDATLLGNNQADATRVFAHDHFIANTNTADADNNDPLLGEVDGTYLTREGIDSSTNPSRDYELMGSETVPTVGKTAPSTASGDETRPVATALNFFIKIND